jgi:hypothetical protein
MSKCEKMKELTKRKRENVVMRGGICENGGSEKKGM